MSPMPGEAEARRGLLFVLSSPSGAGKSTLSRMLLERDPAVEMSVSVTTRAPRPGERDGDHYHFIDEDSFARMRDEGRLLEWASVFDHHYGTPREPVEAAMKAGRDVLFDIDWQGTQQLAQHAHSDLVRVFVLPPSAEALEARLRQRAQDSEAVVARRMAEAANEISHWAEYDYVVVNREIEESYAAVASILAAERLKRERRIGLPDFVRKLQSEL